MEYNTIFFGDVAKIKNGYAFKSKEFQEKGIPVIKIKNIISPIVDTKDSQKVSIKTYEKTKGFSLKKNDILISLTGSGVNQMSSAVGKVGRIEFDYPALQNQRVGKFELKYSNSADLDFLFYYFLQPKITEYLVRNSTGSANQANINSKLIETVKIPNFSLIKQKSISKFLNQITRKIETNQKMIANLKELSQTLFKHWFVDFEFPDEDGNPYKSSGGEMIDSELGEIPSDWKVGVLSDMTEIIMGQSPKSDTYNNNKVGLPLLNGASDFKNRNIKPTKYTSAPKKIGHNLDYVFGVRATIGLVTELDGEYAIGRGAGLSKNNEENREFIYEILNQAFTYFERIGSGSVYINISSKDLKQYKLIIPSKQVLMKYHYQLEPIFSELHNRKEQITSLTNLRDTLLPKLMSGELEIPDDIEVNIDEFSI